MFYPPRSISNSTMTLKHQDDEELHLVNPSLVYLQKVFDFWWQENDRWASDFASTSIFVLHWQDWLGLRRRLAKPAKRLPRPRPKAPACQSTHWDWPHFLPETGPRRLTVSYSGKRIFVWCSRRRLPRPTLTRLLEAPPQSSTDYSENKEGGAHT